MDERAITNDDQLILTSLLLRHLALCGGERREEIGQASFQPISVEMIKQLRRKTDVPPRLRNSYRSGNWK